MSVRNVVLFILISSSYSSNGSIRVRRALQSDELLLPPPPPPPPKPVDPKKGPKIPKEKKVKKSPPPCDERDIPCPTPPPCPENAVCPPPPPPHPCCMNNFTSGESGDNIFDEEYSTTIIEETNGNSESEDSLMDEESIEETILQFDMPSDPILYTGEHPLESVDDDLVKKVTRCITDCSSDCGMYAANSVFFDGVLNVDFTCIESCIDGKTMSCSNIGSCQVKCTDLY